MSSLRESQGSRFGRKRSSEPAVKLTFFNRYYRGIHHTIVILGVSAFFGPFVYRFFQENPPLERAQFPRGQAVPKYTQIEKELDKWR